MTSPPDRKRDDDALVRVSELDGALIEYIYDLDPRRPTLPRPLVALEDDGDELETQRMRRIEKPPEP